MPQQNMSDGERALYEAQRRQRRGGTPEQERQARAAGYTSYAQMLQHMAQQKKASGGVVREGQMQRTVENGFNLHPKRLFDYVTRKYREATR